MPRTISKNNLDFLVSNNMNVLFVGKHGVGKTAIVKETFENRGLKYKYFSAATMDPWTDFIGVPRAIKDENGNDILDMVLPRDFADGSVEALFFDELNRSPKKIRNAVMELIQFKSINGRKFPNLKVVWAAINPVTDDEEYDVERLDPALQDRFHVTIEIPYLPSYSFFKKTYGHIGSAAVKWWKEQDHSVKDLISPRRLDYALQVYSLQGDISQMFDKKVNTKSLKTILKDASYYNNIKEITQSKNKEAAKEFISKNVNNKTTIINLIYDPSNINISQSKFVNFWVPFIEKQQLAALISSKKTTNTLLNIIKKAALSNPDLKDLIKEEEDIPPLTSEEWKSRYNKLSEFLESTITRYKTFENIMDLALVYRNPDGTISNIVQEDLISAFLTIKNSSYLESFIGNRDNPIQSERTKTWIRFFSFINTFFSKKNINKIYSEFSSISPEASEFIKKYIVL